jgi:hypothetical protein
MSRGYIFSEEQPAVAVPVVCDLITVIDARADDRFVFLQIPAPEPAGAVLHAELSTV